MSRLVVATADTEFEARVRSAFDDSLNGDLRRCGISATDDPSRAVTELTRDGTQVVAIGPDVDLDEALALARSIDSQRPDVTVVIVAEPSKDVLRSALRAGARDVVAPHAPESDLRVALEEALEATARRRGAMEGDESAVPSRHVITVLCPKGGAGKTTVSTNLAVGLAQAAPGEVVIVDLDLQFGDVASALRLDPEHTMADTMRARVAVDGAAVKAYLTPHPGNLFALCAPHGPTEADELTPEHVQHVLELLAQSFRYVVIDTPSGLDEFTLGAIEIATDLVILSATDVPSVRSTVKEVDALKVIGSPAQRWHFVLNRADARTGLHLQAIEQSVGLSVDVAIPSSGTVPLSLNQGTPLVEADPKSPVSIAIGGLVQRLAPGAPSAAEEQTKGGGFWRRKSA